MISSICHSLFTLLLGCTKQRSLQAGRSVHAITIKANSSTETLLGNSVVNMYAKCGCLTDASAAFEEIRAGGGWDVVSWNCLINGYSQLGPSGSSSVFTLFHRMRAHGDGCGGLLFPNAFTFAGIFTAASHFPGLVDYGRGTHCISIKTASSADVFVGSSLLNMYCKLELLSDARKVFDRMPHRNTVSWAAMISGYASERNIIEAFRLLKLILLENKSSINEFVITSILTGLTLPEHIQMAMQIHCLTVKNGLASFISVDNSLITSYTKCQHVETAHSIFTSSHAKNPITWSAMITGYAQNGESTKALNLFARMHSNNIKPTEFTLVGILNACRDHSSLSHGTEAHCLTLKLGFDSQIYIRSALIDMYAKCFCIESARRSFDGFQDADTVLWSTMIAALVQNGENEETLAMFRKMASQGVPPNDLTMASVLRACSSLAAFEQGKQVHACALKFGFPIGIPIGSAISTMYAKCGNLDDCNLIFRKMHQRDVVAWNSIISGYAQNGRGTDALNLFDEMKLEGTQPDHVTFINVLSACSHIGLVDQGWVYFNSMQRDYNLSPRLDHFACMVDMLTRAGKFAEAKNFIESVPINHGTRLWRIMLGACRNKKNFYFGALAGEKLMELESKDSSAYVLLSNIYASWSRWEDVERVRRWMKLRGVSKEPGCSWVEIKSRVHVFVVGELLHPEIREIYLGLRWLSKHTKEEGYYFLDVEDELPLIELAS